MNISIQNTKHFKKSYCLTYLKVKGGAPERKYSSEAALSLEYFLSSASLLAILLFEKKVL